MATPFLPQSGVEVVIRGLDRFVQGMNQINRAYSQAQTAAQNLAQKVSTTGDAFARSMNTVVNSERRARNATLDRLTAEEKLAAASARTNAAEQAINQVRNRAATTAAEIAARTRDTAAAINVYLAAVNREILAERALEKAQNNETNALVSYGQAQETASNNMDKFAMVSAQTAQGVNLMAVAGGALETALGAVAVATKAAHYVIQAISVPVKIVQGAFTALKTVVGAVVSAFMDFANRTLSVFAGLSLANLIDDVTNKLKEMGQEVLNGVEFFQKLSIQFRALSARDLAKGLGTDVSAAMKLAAGNAQELLGWVRELAVTSPFNAEDISRSLSLANAFGINVDMAKKLTTTVLDFTAAMGLTGDEVYRIIYNFGQMVATGKLSGQEFRDLGRSFVPVQEILQQMADQAGMSKDAFWELARTGKVDVMGFINAFVDKVNKDFPDAARNMSDTITFVKENWKDFIDLMVGVDLLGPVFNRIATKASNFLKSLITPEVSAQVQKVGQALLFAFDKLADDLDNRLVPALRGFIQLLGSGSNVADSFVRGIAGIAAFFHVIISRVSNFLTQMSTDFASSARSIANNAKKWGEDILSKFADGIVAGARLVLQVLTVIMNTISSILGGGAVSRGISGQTAQLDALRKSQEQAYSALAQASRQQAGKATTASPLVGDRAKIKDEAAKTGAEAGKSTADAYTQALKKNSDVARLTAPLQKAVKDGLNKLKADVGSMGMEAIQNYVDHMKDPDVGALGQMAEKVKSALASFMKNFNAESTTRFLGGVGTVGLNAFKDISSALQGFLSNVPKIGEFDLAPLLLKVREEVAKGVAEFDKYGKISSNAINQIMSAAKYATPVFRDYISAIFQQIPINAQIEAVQKRITEAEKVEKIAKAEADKITKQYDSTLKGLNKTLDDAKSKYDKLLDALHRQLEAVTEEYDERKQLEEINKVLTSTVLTAAERERLENEKKRIQITQQIRDTEHQRDTEVGAIEDKIKAQEAERDAALEAIQRRVDAAEQAVAAGTAELEQLKEKQAAIQELIDKYKALIDIQTEDQGQIKSQIDLYNGMLDKIAQKIQEIGDQTADALDNIGTGITSISNNLPDWSDLQTSFNETFEDMSRRIGQMVDDVQAKFATLTGPGSPLQNFIDAAGRLGEAWRTTTSPGGNLSEAWSNIKKDIESVGKVLENFGSRWDRLMIDFGLKTDDGRLKINLFQLAWEFLMIPVKIVIGLLDVITRGLEFVDDRLQTVRQTLMDIFLPLANFVDKLQLVWDIASKLFSGEINWENISGLGEAVTKAGEAFGKLVITSAIDWLIATIKSVVGSKATEVQGAFGGIVSFIIKAFEALKDTLVGHSIIPDMMNAMYTIMTDKLKALEEDKQGLKPWMERIKKLFNDNFGNTPTSIRKLWKDAWDGMYLDAQSKFVTIETTVATVISNIITSLDRVNTYRATWVEVWMGLQTTVNTAWDASTPGSIPEVVASGVSAVLSSLQDDLLGGINNLDTGGLFDSLQSAMSDFVSWMIDDPNGFVQKMNAVVENGGVLDRLNALLEDLVERIQAALEGFGYLVDLLNNNGGGGGCFVGDTVVMTADGGGVPIADLELGEEVMSFNPESGASLGYGRVVGIFKYLKDERFGLTFSDGSYVEVTGTHPFYCPDMPRDVPRMHNGKFVRVKYLEIGDEIRKIDNVPATIVGKARIAGETAVYNLNVLPFHTYVAGGCYVHNGKTQASQLSGALSTVNAPIAGTTIINNGGSVDRSITVNMAASYANQQSPSSVYYDVSAALASAAR